MVDMYSKMHTLMPSVPCPAFLLFVFHRLQHWTHSRRDFHCYILAILLPLVLGYCKKNIEISFTSIEFLEEICAFFIRFMFNRSMREKFQDNTWQKRIRWARRCKRSVSSSTNYSFRYSRLNWKLFVESFV